MDDTTARALIEEHFEDSNIAVAGGGPDDDIARASEIYAADAVLEWPQGGERIRGKANIIGAVGAAGVARAMGRADGTGDVMLDRPMRRSRRR